MELLLLAEETSCGRLSEICCRVIAQHLEGLAASPDLRQAVADSARSVRNRQATDSIPILDDIAFHVRELLGDGELSDDDEGDIEYGANGGWMPAVGGGGLGARAAFAGAGQDPERRSARARLRGALVLSHVLPLGTLVSDGCAPSRIFYPAVGALAPLQLRASAEGGDPSRAGGGGD